MGAGDATSQNDDLSRGHPWLSAEENAAPALRSLKMVGSRLRCKSSCNLRIGVSSGNVPFGEVTVS